MPVENHYGIGERKHPPTLTRTERLQFIRAYYQFWCMMTLDRTEWQPRFQSMTLKELFHLCEMCKFSQSIGKEEVADEQPVLPICFRRSGERPTLRSRALDHIEQTFQQIPNHNPDLYWVYAGVPSHMYWLVMWDHLQPVFKGTLCNITPPLEDKEDLWNDSSDEEA
ncbi:hypothetical protein MMC13_005270 [Lambiella insularis]|nr:hypothetical protein [Lambiella insularis]